jgi:hypothetical protein
MIGLKPKFNQIMKKFLNLISFKRKNKEEYYLQNMVKNIKNINYMI